ncbi:MAG: ligase-associated DNA damage response exonuclease [Salibacteraceae bacterium]
MALLEFTESGIYCPIADIYIDPWRPVERALITHGHSDHARPGHQHYACHHDSVNILRFRLGQEISVTGYGYGETFLHRGVRFSFHPAGHIIGSAQIRVEYQGEVWVASGDYKLEDDGLAPAYEPVKCHAFITECTFGLPVYKWPDPATVHQEINQWWENNRKAGKVSILSGYSLGKAQRLLHHLDASIGPVFTHGAIENMNEVLRESGVVLPDTRRVTADINKKEYKGGLVLAPPSAIGSAWQKKFQPFSEGIASGWMALRGARRRRSVDRGFILSDHVDWPGVNTAIRETGAQKIITTHGHTSIFTKWLLEQGYQASAESTQFEGELNEMSEADNSEKAA